MPKNSALSIRAVEPTVFFIKEKEELLQAADVAIENTGKSLKTDVEVKIGSQRRCTDIGMVKYEERKYRLYVPDVCESASAEFTLSVNAKVQDRKRIIDRNTHDQLSSAEKFVTIASIISDYSYPLKEINNAYTNTFYYDLHCHGMPGSIGPTQDGCLSEKKNFAYRSAVLSHDILSKSLNKIVDEIEIKDDDYHIIVFNSLSRKRIDVARVPFSVHLPCNQPMHVRYQNGASVFAAGPAIGRNIINPPFDFAEKPFDLIDTETGRKVSYQIVELDSPEAPVPYAASRYALGQFNRAGLFEIVFVAEDENGIIIRLTETEGKDTVVAVKLPFISIT